MKMINMKGKRLTILEHVFAGLSFLQFSVVLKSGIITLETSEKHATTHTHKHQSRTPSKCMDGTNDVVQMNPKMTLGFALLKMCKAQMLLGHSSMVIVSWVGAQNWAAPWNGQKKGSKQKGILHKSCWWNWWNIVSGSSVWFTTVLCKFLPVQNHTHTHLLYI